MSFELEIQATIILKKMLITRGYTLEEDSKEDFTVRGFTLKNRIICFICNEEKLSIQGIKEYMSIMNKENYNRCIIIYRESVTSSAKKSLEIMEYNIELFNNSCSNNINIRESERKIKKKTTTTIKSLSNKIYIFFPFGKALFIILYI